MFDSLIILLFKALNRQMYKVSHLFTHTVLWISSQPLKWFSSCWHFLVWVQISSFQTDLNRWCHSQSNIGELLIKMHTDPISKLDRDPIDLLNAFAMQNLLFNSLAKLCLMVFWAHVRHWPAKLFKILFFISILQAS